MTPTTYQLEKEIAALKAENKALREVATEPVSLTTLHAWGQELLAHLRSVPGAKTGDLFAWGLAHVPPLELHRVEGLVDELVKAGKVTSEASRGGNRRIYRAAPAEVVTEPGWTPNTGAAGSFFGVARSEPAPCAECTRLAEALLSWERLWGVNGTDLAAMEARVQEAETRAAQVTAERDQLAAALAKAKAPTPAEPAGLSPSALVVLEALATTRGTSRREVATRTGFAPATVTRALRSLAAEGSAYESTPCLWRRR